MSIFTSKSRSWRMTNTQEKIDALFTPAVRARFWGKADRSGDCWEWTGSKSSLGYGSFGVRQMTFRANRVAYMLTKGPIPADLHVLHSCDNRACVNPDHLRVGTPGENAMERDQKDRVQCGVTHYCAKLTEDQVREVYLSDERPCDAGQRLGVHASAISAIRKGKKWRRVTEGLSR